MATAITENLGTGKRKTAVARVHLRPGKGAFLLNDQSLDEFFGGHETLKMIVRQPFVATETIEKFDVIATVDGGGVAARAGAIRHGIARALLDLNEEFRARLRKEGLLTRDSRIEHIARAAVDAMAYQTRDVLEVMQQEAGLVLPHLKVDGGASATF